MSDEQKPGDPADRAADGAFGGVQSHRAGYGDDKLQRLTEWLRAHPTATLASGEGALLLGENDRLRDDLQKQADWADWAKGEMERLTDKLNMACRDRDIAHAAAQSFARDRDRAERILAALRAPSTKVLCAALAAFNNAPFPSHTPRLISALLAAVEATEQEVGRE